MPSSNTLSCSTLPYLGIVVRPIPKNEKPNAFHITLQALSRGGFLLSFLAPDPRATLEQRLEEHLKITRVDAFLVCIPECNSEQEAHAR